MNTLIYVAAAIAERLQEHLRNPDDWSDMLVKGRPQLERLLKTVRVGKDNRYVFLHRLVAFAGRGHLHRHPWEFAAIILQGSLEMEIGCGLGDEPPKKPERLALSAGDRYSMSHPSQWHALTPITEEVILLELIGDNFNPPIVIKNPPSVDSLSQAQRMRMFEACRAVPALPTTKAKSYMF